VSLLSRDLSRPLAAVVGLLVTAVGAVAVAPDASADTLAPAIDNPDATNEAVHWTPPPEPTLVPVPAAPCPKDPAPGHVTCLTEAPAVVPDAKADAAGRSDAIATSDTAAAPLPDSAVPQALTQTGGYSPAQLASLYRIPAGVSSTATIGIVDVGSDPNTQAQLSYYRAHFGLPACTKANGCFREVAQNGSTTLPPTNSGWVTEIALDVQAVSAICPTCHILLVDAKSASSTDMGTAVNTAARLGATYVSLSFGAPDSLQNATLASTFYNNPGVTYVAASGDSGYSGGTIFPSTAPNVVAAGGTSVKLVNGVWQQSAWSGAGSGCSSAGLVSGVVNGLVQRLLSASACPAGRAVTDVSALADPATGIMFYRGGQWYMGGGTSLAAPIITALYALAGNHTDPLAVYRNVTSKPSAFVDITTGQTGTCGTVLCTARTGWDGPTGVGTPAGLAGLASSGAAQLPLAAPTTAGALHLSGSYPARLQYRLVDATTGAPIPHAPVLVEANTGHGFGLLVRTTTAADGSLTYLARPHGVTSYRVFYGGAASHASSVSPTVRAAAFAPSVGVRKTAHGLRVTAIAPWQQRVGGLRLKVQRHTGGWHTVKKVTTSARGNASVRLRPGAYRVVYGGGQWRTGHSRSVRLKH
jgi:hypothetical protein